MSRFEGSLRTNGAAAGVAALCGALVLVATRSDPMLSPDSITYLSVADHLRHGAGLTDFTGKPLTVFGPVFPVLLSPGGSSLAWASIVGAASVAVAVLLMYRLLRHRVTDTVALAGATVLGAAQGLVRVASTVWSETPYMAISLAVLLMVARSPLRLRDVAAAGVLAGLGFLTRYAGAGLVVTGLTVVLVDSWHLGTRRRWRAPGVFAAAAGIPCLAWVIGNLVRSGQALGPRFEGGARDSLGTLARLPLRAVGVLLLGADTHPDTALLVGELAMLGVALVLAVGAWRWKQGATRGVDLGMAMFALTSLVLPVVARAITANDIEYRVMSPMLVPLVFATVVAVAPLCRLRAAAAALAVVGGLWCWQGVRTAIDVPGTLAASAGNRNQFSPALYDVVTALPADAHVLTNNPQRVWWQTRHEPTLFAFTRPRAGNSHYPLDPAHTLALSCSGPTYLAWFDGLANAGGGPDERRPDVLAVVDLQLERTVPGGRLFVVTPRDTGRCDS